MTKLLRAGIRIYLHSFVFWLAIAITVVSAVMCGNHARALYYDDPYIIIVLAAAAAMVSWLVGRENGEGIFRNKLVSGHSKGNVFLSELILGIGACVLMYLLFAVIFLCFNSYIIGVVSTVPALKIFLSCLLATACFAAIFVTVSCLVPQRAIIAIINILLVFGLIFVVYTLQDRLNQPEYYYETDYREVTYTDEYGNVHMQMEPIEETERPIENKYYLDSPLREIFEVTNNVLPFSHFNDAKSIVGYWFGYTDYFGEDTWENSANLEVTEESEKMLTYNLIYSAVVLLVISGIGYICFRKKDLK